METGTQIENLEGESRVRPDMKTCISLLFPSGLRFLDIYDALRNLLAVYLSRFLWNLENGFRILVNGPKMDELSFL